MDTYLSLTVTFLEQSRPDSPATPEPLPYCLKDQIVLQHWQPNITGYRDLYIRVGQPYLWWQRLVLSDQELSAILFDSTTELYALFHAGTAIGFCEITTNSAPETCNIAYFGLVSGYEQSGLGGALMRQMLAHIWHHPSKPTRATVNTCTMDHPKALGFYKYLGFTEIRREDTTIRDPRNMFELYSK